MGWAFLGNFSLSVGAAAAFQPLFSTLLCSSHRKALCGVSSRDFFLLPLEVLGLSNPAAPSPTSGNHGPRPPLLPSLALAFTQSFELAPYQGGMMGLGVFGAAAAWRDYLRGVKDGFSSFLLFLPRPRYKKYKK